MDHIEGGVYRDNEDQLSEGAGGAQPVPGADGGPGGEQYRKIPGGL